MYIYIYKLVSRISSINSHVFFLWIPRWPTDACTASNKPIDFLVISVYKLLWNALLQRQYIDSIICAWIIKHQKLVSITRSHIQVSSQISKLSPRSVIAHPLKRHFPPSPQTNHLPTHHFSGAKVLNFGGFFPHQKTPCFFTPKKSGPRHGDVRWWRSWIPPNGKLRAFDDIFLKMCGFFSKQKMWTFEDFEVFSVWFITNRCSKGWMVVCCWRILGVFWKIFGRAQFETYPVGGQELNGR